MEAQPPTVNPCGMGLATKQRSPSACLLCGMCVLLSMLHPLCQKISAQRPCSPRPAGVLLMKLLVRGLTFLPGVRPVRSWNCLITPSVCDERLQQLLY